MTARLIAATPKLASLDVERSLMFFERLGFKRLHTSTDYGVARRDSVSVHFWLCSDPRTPRESACRISVEGIGELFETYSTLGASIQMGSSNRSLGACANSQSLMRMATLSRSMKLRARLIVREPIRCERRSTQTLDSMQLPVPGPTVEILSSPRLPDGWRTVCKFDRPYGDRVVWRTVQRRDVRARIVRFAPCRCSERRRTNLRIVRSSRGKCSASWRRVLLSRLVGRPPWPQRWTPPLNGSTCPIRTTEATSTAFSPGKRSLRTRPLITPTFPSRTGG